MKRTLTLVCGLLAFGCVSASTPNPFAPPGGSGGGGGGLAPAVQQAVPAYQAPPISMPPVVPPGPETLEEDVPVVLIGKVNGTYIFRGTSTYLFEKPGDTGKVVRKPKLPFGPKGVEPSAVIPPMPTPNGAHSPPGMGPSGRAVNQPMPPRPGQTKAPTRASPAPASPAPQPVKK
ncbi:hypothetical protein LC612_23075 [Nostoc sp. CHAB 5834]|nr:hypothetical protein [Nostoc sp. CHAB 5834]